MTEVIFEPILVQIWETWKIDRFIYQITHFIRGHSYIKRLTLLPMLAAHPRRFFCTKYPQRVVTCLLAISLGLKSPFCWISDVATDLVMAVSSVYSSEPVCTIYKKVLFFFFFFFFYFHWKKDIQVEQYLWWLHQYKGRVASFPISKRLNSVLFHECNFS